MRENIVNYFERHSLISDSHHGFRYKSLSILLKFYIASISRYHEIIVYLDFKKAFDKVAHKNVYIESQTTWDCRLLKTG